MKRDLPLRSLEIEGYRGIRYLRLAVLERVNLFVGLNNAGKTSLLEAVQLYTSPAPRIVLRSILRERSGFRPRFSSTKQGELTADDMTAAVNSVRSLFYGTFDGKIGSPIRIGPADGDALTISLPWAASAVAGTADAARDLELFLEPESPLIQLERASQTAVISLDWFLRRFGVMLTGMSKQASFIPAAGFDSNRLSEMWDQAASAGHAPDVEDVLRSVVPNLERIHLLGEPGGGGRSIAIQLRGTGRPMPLTSMGDGTNRVFGLALACARARGGVLLVDEVENGLHHSVQAEVWESIFSLAERLDVQVFATTHSWEAVVAFQEAANRSPAKGMLYRLEPEEDGKIYAERYTDEDVAVAAEQQVEVR
jgi:AAA domain, putative AbiEii toxin, Type IV TA system/Protein of unknown function (DUF2813)